LFNQVAAMTDTKYAGTVIIIAGYSDEMEQLLRKNPGQQKRLF
jgi:hypothetical protein